MSYVVAAYGLTVVLVVGYGLSIVVRHRQAQRQLAARTSDPHGDVAPDAESSWPGTEQPR